MKRAIVIAISVLLTLIVALPVALAQGEQGTKASGKAAELAAAWTKWAYSTTVDDSPVIGEDPNYSEEQCDGTPVSPTQGKTWFLAGKVGSSGGEETVRTCTAPVGTHFFFPLGECNILHHRARGDQAAGTRIC